MTFWFFMLFFCFLTPAIMIGFGSYFKKGKPEEINIAFGYRSSMSMKNQDTWLFAHLYCGKLWYILGWILFPLSLTAMLCVIGREENVVGGVSGIIILVQVVPLLGTIYFVEKALKKHFHKDGSRKMDYATTMKYEWEGEGGETKSYQPGNNLFITFEGIEGSGKSTQVNLLKEALESDGHEVFVTREPGGPAISEKIREILLDPENKEMTSETELLLYLASRNQHTSQWILPALQKGQFVICDRYFDSTLAYQGVARKLEISMIQKINNFATYGLKPDITFILDIPLDMSKERQKGKELDRIESENKDFHKAVKQAFLDISKENERYIVIDGRKKIEDIKKEIYKRVIEKIQEEK